MRNPQSNNAARRAAATTGLPVARPPVKGRGSAREDDYLEPIGDPILTKERELELGRAVEQAETMLLDAILSSPVALEELAFAVSELSDPSVPLSDFARPKDGEHHDDAKARTELVNVIDAAVHGEGAHESSGSRSSRRRGRADVAKLLAGYQLSARVLDRLVRRLEAEANRRPSAPTSRKEGARETATMIRRARRELRSAREELIRCNMRLVVWMAKKYINQGLPLVDLIQEGNIGLMRAADKFDYRRGVRFGTYAGWWIRQSLNRALSDQSRMVRMPVYLLDRKHKLARVRQAFAEEHGRDPTLEETAARTGLTVEQLDELLRIPKQPVSMDAPLGPENDTKLGDTVPDPRAVSPLESISRHRMRAEVRRMLSKLNPREKKMLMLRYGTDVEEGMTLQEIGDQFSLSRERVRQIEQEALEKLRKEAESEDLRSFLSA